MALFTWFPHLRVALVIAVLGATSTTMVPVWVSAQAPSPTTAPTTALTTADEAWSEGDFDAAIDSYEHALRSGSLARTEVAHVLRMVGIFRSIFNDQDAAQHAFERSLALEPAQPTPTELPPGRMAAFNGARSENHGPMRLLIRAEASPDGSVLVTPTLVRAPPNWAERVLVIVSETPGGEPLWQGDRATVGPVTIPARAVTGVIHIQLIVHDSFGNTLAGAESSFGVPAVLDSVEAGSAVDDTTLWTPVEEDDEGDGVLASPVFWVVVGAVIIGGIITAVLLTSEGETTLGDPHFAAP